jgi:serine phosphatase RsbU (regulator of sigma subunit)/anti-sigma regulatory factor (Ser/Thr protein kinase)
VDLVAAATYDPGSAAVPAARRFVRETLTSWQVPGCDDLLADAELLTSELVTNAVLHADTPVRVTCRAHRCEVEVSVLDWQPESTIPGGQGRVADVHREAGRGLVLLAALSSSWGVTYAPAAKTVWFRLQPGGVGPAHPDVYAATAPDKVDGFGQAWPDRYTDQDSARVHHVAGQVALPLGRAKLKEQDRARHGRISFLAEASDLLAGTLDQEQTTALAAQLVVPRLAAWCAVLLTDENGASWPARAWHADEARNDALSFLLKRVPPPQASSLEAGLQWPPAAPPGEQLTPEAAELAADPAWSFPLLARGRSLGVLVMGRPDGGALGSQALAVAEDLTRRVALALDNARLYSGQLQASHALQRSLLPPQLPEVPGLDVAAGYQAAGEGDEVGGDFYDVFKVAPRRWRFAIGDVCGKGLEAAAVTGLTRHALRILAREGHDIPAVLERLNSLILEEGSAVPFVTLIHGEIEMSPGRASVSMVCAGHPPPILLRSQGGTKIAADSQPLLGVMAGATFRSDTCNIRRDDVLLCVTDGVTERRSGDRLLDDDNGLRQLLSDCSGLNAGAIVARIQRKVHEFGSGPPSDDTALIAFRGQ